MKKLFLLSVMCLVAITMQAQKCAVLEFRGASSVSVSDVDGISEMFMTYFRPAGYTMVERAQIDKVISEQGFQRSSLTDAQAVRVGRILNVSKVVVGKVSRLGGQYQVDVRVVDVESGHDIALEGSTFSGDYRTNVRNLSTKLASKISIKSGPTVQATPKPSTTSRSRSTVETVYGYLKVFPNELGTFQSEPTTIISQINKQAKYGYNNWRIPTNEELSLLKANNYLGSGEYMSRESRSGIVLLVTDGKDYATERAEAHAQGYVDLGLPSGTLWKNTNEPEYYTYKEAVSKFGKKIPTKTQFEELMNKCTWSWNGSGYKITGPNGKFIVLPAKGVYYPYNGRVDCNQVQGYYYTTTTTGERKVYFLFFHPTGMSMSSEGGSNGKSIRLIQD